MAIKRKKQHKCKSIREYRQILSIYNPNSALNFDQRGWAFYEEQIRRLIHSKAVI